MSSTVPAKERTADEVESVRAFFNSQWNLYRRILDLNYLHHREVGQILHGVLQKYGHGFSFLDLACGDAAMTSAALKDSGVRYYSGVDISSVALNLARENLVPLGCDAEFFESDYLSFLSGVPRARDIAYVGLSVHHLREAGKAGFLKHARPWIAPEGRLILFEPVSRPAETRDDYMVRWVECQNATWTALSAEEISAARDHVLQFDYPDDVETFRLHANEAGFSKVEVLYRDEDELYAILEMMA